MSLERYFLTAENSPTIDPPLPKMNPGFFRSVLDAYLFDARTGVQCKTAIEWNLNNQNIPFTLTPNDVVDVLAVLAFINVPNQDTEKMLRADNLYRIIYGAVNMENSPDPDPWYATQATLRAKLNWSEQD